MVRSKADVSDMYVEGEGEGDGTQVILAVQVDEKLKRLVAEKIIASGSPLGRQMMADKAIAQLADEDLMAAALKDAIRDLVEKSPVYAEILPQLREQVRRGLDEAIAKEIEAAGQAPVVQKLIRDAIVGHLRSEKMMNQLRRQASDLIAAVVPEALEETMGRKQVKKDAGDMLEKFKDERRRQNLEAVNGGRRARPAPEPEPDPAEVDDQDDEDEDDDDQD